MKTSRSQGIAPCAGGHWQTGAPLRFPFFVNVDGQVGNRLKLALLDARAPSVELATSNLRWPATALRPGGVLAERMDCFVASAPRNDGENRRAGKRCYDAGSVQKIARRANHVKPLAKKYSDVPKMIYFTNFGNIA
jgi:hypothetical protein